MNLISCTVSRYCIAGCPKLISKLLTAMNTKHILTGTLITTTMLSIPEKEKARLLTASSARNVKNCPQHLPIQTLSVAAAKGFEK